MTVQNLERFTVKPPTSVLSKVINKCRRCSGTGHIEAYSHIEDGICFECRAHRGYGMSLQDFQEAVIIEQVADPRCDSILTGQLAVIASQEVLEGAARLAIAGFDDEILLDYAHQMSKN